MPSTPSAMWVPNAGIQATDELQLEPGARGRGVGRVANQATIAQHELDAARRPCAVALASAALARSGTSTSAPTSGHQEQDQQERVAPGVRRDHANRTASMRRDDEDRAAEHGQGVGPDEAGLQPAQPPGAAAEQRRPVPLTTPSTPRLSKNTRARVSQMPGPRDERLVDRVGVQVAAGRAHRQRHRLRALHRRRAAGRRPGRRPARRARRAPSTSHGTTACGSAPPSSSSQLAERRREPLAAARRESRTPAKTEPNASTIIGDRHRRPATRAGGSARPSGAVRFSQRCSPKNVMSTRRVM